MREKDILDITLNQLMEKAREDGLITDEENELIQQIKVDVETYTKILKESMKDGVISKEEGRKLQEFKQYIINSAENVAMRDGKISEAEKELIQRLSNLIITYFKKY